MEKRKIVVQKLDREKVVAGVSYDGQEEAKKIDLAQPGEEAKPAYILANLTAKEEEQLIALLKEYKDGFTWLYKDLKGVDPKICQHTIPMREMPNQAFNIHILNVRILLKRLMRR